MKNKSSPVAARHFWNSNKKTVPSLYLIYIATLTIAYKDIILLPYNIAMIPPMMLIDCVGAICPILAQLMWFKLIGLKFQHWDHV